MQFSLLRHLFLFPVLACCLCSCDSSEENNRQYTYFGGEIVNPNTNYIVLSKENNTWDTIYLDKNNRFLHRIDNLKEGLYSFRHNPEYQIVILEKGDSVLIRLNTLEFDESLVFTGDGARKNNFMIDMFLQNETEREQLRKNDFKLSPIDFKKKQDSLLRLRSEAYNRLINKYNISDLSRKIVNSSFKYDFHSRHEMYFYKHYGITNLDSINDMPESFFTYREAVNFNDNELKRLYSYNRFLNHYFTNSTYTHYAKGQSYRKDPVGNIIYELDLIDSLIQHSYIKNNLLKGVTYKFLLESKDDYASRKVLKHYLSVSTNKKFQKELKRLARATSRLKPNNTIPDQDLIAATGETVKLSSLFNKPITAMYFWSVENKDHYMRAHKKASYLSALYPEIDFIGINTDDDQTKNWVHTIKRNQFDLNREYEFKYPKCSSEELIIHYRDKVILVDNKGKIINANANLFSSYFEKQLIQYTRLASIQN
ncbi:hypothetical protein [Aquimarina sp. 2201CG5-10]|uniref:hypothetical protein n=1 Tax=Aquimarina callyspongiae TaxID=3098150 RepID=UPI002AB36DAB|nr:hypothetical protein [Aquimarina sp. 2201CG5-10]MDY8135343.1 hypothetical protein [Aquimarina sp. 2201CG5-10]